MAVAAIGEFLRLLPRSHAHLLGVFHAIARSLVTSIPKNTIAHTVQRTAASGINKAEGEEAIKEVKHRYEIAAVSKAKYSVTIDSTFADIASL
jgi:hypothetical protein